MDEIIVGGIHEFIDNLQLNLNEIGAGIYETFLTRRSLNPTGIPVRSDALQ